MSGRDDEAARADEVTRGALHQGLVGRVVGDLAAVLQVLGVSKQGGADHLLLNGSVEVADGGGNKSSTLAMYVQR